MDTHIATPEEEGRITGFAADLHAKGRRPGTIGAYQCDWQKLATWSSALNAEPFDFSAMVGREAAELKEHTYSDSTKHRPPSIDCSSSLPSTHAAP